MLVENLAEIKRLQRLERHTPIDPEKLRITRNGISVKGEAVDDLHKNRRNPARIHEAICTKRTREQNEGKFVISTQVLDRMAYAKRSVFANGRPDVLILQPVSDPDSEYFGQTMLWGMEEFKSGERKQKTGREEVDYGLAGKAGIFYRLIQALEDKPNAIALDLIDAISDSYDRIPIDLEKVVVPEVVHVGFKTDSQALEVSPTAYPRMVFSYEVVNVPRIAIPVPIFPVGAAA